MFSGCTVPPDSKETKLGSSNRETSPSAGKNTGIVPCRTWKYVPTAISGGVDISEVPGYHLLRQMSSQRGSQKLLQGLVSHELTVYGHCRKIYFFIFKFRFSVYMNRYKVFFLCFTALVCIF